MSLTKEQLDEMRALARATLSESMSQEDIRRVHTDLCSNILALLDALEESEQKYESLDRTHQAELAACEKERDGFKAQHALGEGKGEG